MKKFYVLGDSLVLGKNNQGEFLLKEVLPHYQLTIKGKIGATTFDVLSWLPYLNFSNYDGVILMIGTNDAAFKSEIVPFYFRKNLTEIIGKISKPIYFITPPYVDEKKRWERSNERLWTYCEVIKEFPVTIIDFYQALKKYTKLSKTSFRSL